MADEPTTEQTTEEAPAKEPVQTSLLTGEEPKQESGSLLTGEVKEEEGGGEQPETTVTHEPIDYTDINLPESYKDHADSILEAAKAGGVAKASLESVLASIADADSKRQEAMAESAKAQEMEQVEQYQKTVLEDPQAKELLADANRVLRDYADADTKKWLQDNPLVGNHPGLLRVLANVGAIIGEAKVRRGETVSSEPLPAHKRIYTTMK